MTRKLDLRFSIAYLVLGIAVIVLELVGIHRDNKHAPAGLAAITDNWRWLDSHAWGVGQWVLRVFTVGLLAWVALHFGGNW